MPGGSWDRWDPVDRGWSLSIVSVNRILTLIDVGRPRGEMVSEAALWRGQGKGLNYLWPFAVYAGQWFCVRVYYKWRIEA